MTSLSGSAAESLSHRARLSSLISSLRPLRLRTSVFSLLAHRIPTLWTLYRGLLRNSPTEDIRWRIRVLFRQHKTMRKAVEVRDVLRRYHQWAQIFSAAKDGDARSQAILQRYSRMIVAKKDKEHLLNLVREDIAWRKRLANRPILTGSYIRPSFSNGPLPQMKPLPIHVATLIHSRRKRRQKRIEELSILNNQRQDLALERDFESALAQAGESDDVKLERIYSDDFEEWDHPLAARLKEIHETFERDNARASRPFPPEMLRVIKAARREKVENKTRELQRERRGVVLKRTLARRRQGPPAYVLAKMTEKDKHMDKVSRSVSEVGYVAQMKEALGFKLRDPDASKMEMGRPENRERLDKMLQSIRAENARRQAKDSLKP